MSEPPHAAQHCLDDIRRRIQSFEDKNAFIYCFESFFTKEETVDYVSKNRPDLNYDIAEIYEFTVSIPGSDPYNSHVTVCSNLRRAKAGGITPRKLKQFQEAASAESAALPKVLEVEKNTEPEGTPVEEVKPPFQSKIKTVPLSPQVEIEINNFKSIFSFHARRRVKPKQMKMMKKNFVQQFINCIERCYTKEKTLDYMREHCMPDKVEEFFNMFMERLAGIGRGDWYNQKAAEEKVLDTKIQDFKPMLSFLARTYLKPNHMKKKFLEVFRSCLERGYSKERILHQLMREDCDCEDHKVEEIFERFREYLGGSGRHLYDKKVGEQNKGVSELEDPVLVKRALSRFLKKMGADHLYSQIINNLGEEEQKTIGVLCLRMIAAEPQEEKDTLSHDLFCHCDSCERSYRI